MASRLTLRVPADFRLFKAVCSYGHFLLAPSRWDRDKQQLFRVLRDTRQRKVHSRITQPDKGKPLVIHCDRTLNREDQQHIKRQTIRMLRIDEDVSPWYKLHRTAKRRGFSRLFRGTDLFEDIVKTITSCNVTWPNTVNMSRLLVEHVGHGGFPTPEQVADFGEQRLKDRCKVGYRAGRIAQLGRDVADGTLDLSWFEHGDRTSDEVYDALLKLNGIGPYAAANVCMLLGYYDRMAIDTETYRHYCKHHNVKRPKDPSKLHKRIEKHYGQYDPYAFLAYWFELWRGYEKRFGPSEKWDHEKDAKQFTAAAMKD
ncbi:MAG: endonuclease III domain-containing protein [Phycisphaeraceae bacterium]|nr:endonuclease III domain-containing protein [Phycisphaeraceae bacterium]